MFKTKSVDYESNRHYAMKLDRIDGIYDARDIMLFSERFEGSRAELEAFMNRKYAPSLDAYLEHMAAEQPKAFLWLYGTIAIRDDSSECASRRIRRDAERLRSGIANEKSLKEILLPVFGEKAVSENGAIDRDIVLPLKYAILRWVYRESRSE